MSAETHSRLRILHLSYYVAFLLLVGRLFYWQVIKSPELKAQAVSQYEREIPKQASRGRILTSDGYVLVANQPVYRVFVEKNLLTEGADELAHTLTPYLLPDLPSYQTATEAAERETIATDLNNAIQEKINQAAHNWVGLFSGLSETQKKALASLDIAGLGFDVYEKRLYPEASMAAQVTGFVGKDAEGYDTGYFGIEGAMNSELQGYAKTERRFTDALGLQLLFFEPDQADSVDGRDVYLSIRRDVQLLLETELQAGMQRYGAKQGEAIVIEPQTGKILGMASYPNYNPTNFFKFDPKSYKNPSVADFYEPGSTFKVLTMAAAIDSGTLKPDSTCPRCDGPRTISGYTIRTWNDEYHPDITMQDALAKSDNIAMIYAVEEMGSDTFQQYLQAFEIGKPTGVELQEEVANNYPEKWGPVELATRSFGQGISLTSLQLLKAINSIANGGKLLDLSVVDKVVDKKTGQTLPVLPKTEKQVISPASARTVAQMMQYAASKGEAQWVASKTYTVAAKTGTSQIPDKQGGYKANATIASFVGFSPVENPQFLLFVKLVEPQTSPWAAETAAPLWYSIAGKLHLLL